MCSILAFTNPAADEKTVAASLAKTVSRGPDMTRIVNVNNNRGYMGFNRLVIMGLTEKGMQPFVRGNKICVCNGELYGFRKTKKELERIGYTFLSNSDCELLIPLWQEKGVDMFRDLDAEFAMVL